MDGLNLLREGHETRGKFYQTSDLAELLHTSRRTLERWRSEGRGPDYYQVSNGRVLYAARDVESWLESRRVGRPNPTTIYRVADVSDL